MLGFRALVVGADLASERFISWPLDRDVIVPPELRKALTDPSFRVVTSDNLGVIESGPVVLDASKFTPNWLVESNGGLTVTMNPSTLNSGDNPSVVSTVSATGKLIFRGIWNVASAPDTDAFGVCNSQFNPSLPNNWIGIDANSISIWNDGLVWYNGNVIFTTGWTFGNGDYVLVAVDTNAGLIWFQRNGTGNWNNTPGANPVTGVGGIPLGIAGALFAGGVLYTIPISTLTFDFAPANPPAGYRYWPASPRSYLSVIIPTAEMRTLVTGQELRTAQAAYENRTILAPQELRVLYE